MATTSYSYQHLSAAGVQQTNVQVDLILEPTVDLNNLDDILTVTCNFDKLSMILKLLLQSNKNFANHIANINRQMNQFEKVKDEQRSVVEKIKELNDKYMGAEDQMFNMNQSMTNIKVSLNDTSALLDTTRRDNDSNLERIEKLETDLILLKDEHDTRLITLNSNINYIKDNYYTRARTDEFLKNLQSLIDKDIRSLNDDVKHIGIRMSEIENQLPSMNLKVAENQQQILQLKEKINMIDESIDKLRANVANNARNIDENAFQIKGLEKKVQEKVSCETFDKEINYLKSMLGHLKNKALDDARVKDDGSNSSNGSQFNGGSIGNTNINLGSKQLNLLNELDDRLSDLDDKIRQLISATSNIPRMEDFLTKLNASVNDIYGKIKDLQNGKADKTALQELQAKLLSIETQLEEQKKLDGIRTSMIGGGMTSDPLMQLIQKQEILAKKILELENNLADLRKLVGRAEPKNTVQINESPANSQEISELRDLLNSVKRELEAIRQAMVKSVKDLEGKLKFKADLNRQNELEKILMDQLNEQMNILNNKVDDIKKCKSGLSKCENNMKKLQEFVMDQLAQMSPTREGNYEEDDAMFAKRPLVGWSCASCDKDIVNLQGKIADYHPWSRMPMRDPTDRISRVGQGFSRMLASVKPEFLEKMKKSQRTFNQTVMIPEQSTDDNMGDGQEESRSNSQQKPTTAQSANRKSKSQMKSVLSKTHHTINSQQVGVPMTERSATQQEIMGTPNFKRKAFNHLQQSEGKLTLSDNHNVFTGPTTIGSLPGSKSLTKLPQLNSKTPTK